MAFQPNYHAWLFSLFLFIYVKMLPLGPKILILFFELPLGHASEHTVPRMPCSKRLPSAG